MVLQSTYQLASITMHPDIVSRIKAAAKAASADPTLLPAMAAAFNLGTEIAPTEIELRWFHAWLSAGVDKLEHAGVSIACVDREVPLTEAMHALTRPLLPVEDRLLPVSTIGNAPVPGLMTEHENLMFRAVHDAMHAKLGADDSWEGELAVTLGHLMTSPPQIWPILASEVAGQAAVAIFEGEFPEQRLSGACLPMLAHLIEQVI
jgi:hypothetical protein